MPRAITSSNHGAVRIVLSHGRRSPFCSGSVNNKSLGNRLVARADFGNNGDGFERDKQQKMADRGNCM